MIAPDPDLDALFKRLHLANARRVWRDLVQRAERDAWSYHDFLTLLVTEEIAHRQQTRLGRLTRRAHFPFLKTIDDFNFTYQSTVRLQLLGSALAPDFVTEGRCLILGGKPGRGKTHLAVAIAYRAIQNGFDALFVTAAELIDDLSGAFRSGRLAEALDRYVHPAVVVCDEVGYLTYGTDAANMLFHVVNDRHRKKRTMIFTTNKPLTGWGRVLHDDDLAHAIVDRILERGRVLTLDGPSMRTRHLGLDDPTAHPASTQSASLSGEGARILRKSSDLSTDVERDDSGRSGFDEERIHTEFGKPSLVVVHQMVALEAVEILNAQFAIVHAVPENVPGRDQNGVSDCDDGLLVATSLGEASVLRGEVAVPFPHRSPSALNKRRA